MKQNILLVDDSKHIHTLVSALLAEEDVTISDAYDGESGLTLAKSLHPDLILLDVEMPGLTGYDVCRQLKSDPNLFNIPVIFLTALSSTEEKVSGLGLGAADYVTKPFSPAELLARVRAQLRTFQIIQLLEERALVDFLTGLGNRTMFKQRLAAEVSLRIRTRKELACIAVDVDDFQQINDKHGHPFADRLLQTIARHVKEVCRVEDVPCRLGGDAFVILTPNTDVNEAALLAKRLDDELAAIKLNCRGVPVEVKCSVAVAPAIGVYDRAMVERANQAIEEARGSGQSGVAIAGTLELAEA